VEKMINEMSSSEKIDPTRVIPEEVWSKVLSNLDGKSLVTCSFFPLFFFLFVNPLSGECANRVESMAGKDCEGSD
jgi:hypothetical protein